MSGLVSLVRAQLTAAMFAVILVAMVVPTTSVFAADQYPLTPAPSLCSVEPRTVDELESLFANATPVADAELATSNIVEPGTPADKDQIDAVTQVIVEAFACQNAGDFARFFALISDETIAQYFGWIGEMLSDEEMVAELMAATPVDTEYQQTILSIGGVTALSEERVSAVVIYDDPNAGDEPSALVLTFAEIDSTWQIVNVIDFQAE